VINDETWYTMQVWIVEEYSDENDIVDTEILGVYEDDQDAIRETNTHYMPETVQWTQYQPSKDWKGIVNPELTIFITKYDVFGN
jgi:hypothetical protein